VNVQLPQLKHHLEIVWLCLLCGKTHYSDTGLADYGDLISEGTDRQEATSSLSRQHTVPSTQITSPVLFQSITKASK
jgi:hypothetical protein